MALFLKLVKPFYPQVFLEKYKTNVKEKEVTKHINKGLENYSDSDESDVEQTLKKSLMTIKLLCWKLLPSLKYALTIALTIL